MNGAPDFGHSFAIGLVVVSFRAECPAPLLLREAPGHRTGLPGRRLVEPGR